MSSSGIFLSYKRGHAASEELISDIRQGLGGQLDFLQDVEIEPGRRWSRELHDWLLGCAGAIVLISEDANASDWCRREWSVLWARCESTELPILPIHVEDHFVTTNLLDELESCRSNIGRDELLDVIRKTFEKIEYRSPTPIDYLAAHRAWLSWQFRDAPVFQREPYSLAQVYVEPECGVLQWRDIRGNKQDPFKEDAESGGRQPLLDKVLELLGSPDFKDLLMLQAGPGAGKSAFTLRLGDALREQGLQPIVIRFRDLRLGRFDHAGELLDDAIRIGYSDEDSPNPQGEIITALLEERVKFGQTEICKTVIILDGWDEVSLTGNESYKAQLSTWLPKLREYFIDKRGARVRLIMTGRPSTEVSDSGVMRDATPVLTLRPMQPEQLRGFAEDISGYLTNADQEQKADSETQSTWTLDTQRLEPVFEHYAAWFGSKDRATTSSAGDFLGNPLLAYLAFNVLARSTQDPADLIGNPTALYQELINITVQHSGKGEDADLENSVHQGGDSLRRLLQEVAVTVSILRAESASYKELEARFTDRELPLPPDLVANWNKDANTDTALRELVVNFYFKGGNAHLGCEFLHKSFHEFLYAEAIFQTLQDISKGENGNFKSRKQYEYWEDFEKGSIEFRLSRRLSYLLAPQWMSKEVRTHLFWLIEKDIQREPERWLWIRDLLLEVYAWWAEGVFTRHQPTRSRGRRVWEPPFVDTLFLHLIPFDDEAEFNPYRSTVLDAHLGESLMQITAWVFHCYRANTSEDTPPQQQRCRHYFSTADGKTRLQPGGGGFFRNLVSRIDSEGWRKYSGISQMLLPSVDLSNEDLSNLTGIEVNLMAADLSKAFLVGAELTGANLSSSIFFAAHLERATLSFSDLSFSNFKDSDLFSAWLVRTKLTKTNLQQANLTRALIDNADFSSADLYGAAVNQMDLVQTLNPSDAQLPDDYQANNED